MLDTLMSLGGEVKAIESTDDTIKVGGYLVLFGSPDQGDLSRNRDYFTKSTDFGLEAVDRGIIRWYHCLDPKIGSRKLGVAEVKAAPDDLGLWAEGWMHIRDAYDRRIADWVRQRKVGWSTAALPHTVERKAAVAGANEIVSWPLGGGDFTLTLTPADPRQLGRVVEMKTWIDGDAAAARLNDDLVRLASDAGDLWPLVERAHSARKSEGRGLSADKLAALERVHQNVGRLLSECQRGEPEAKRASLAELGELLARVGQI